ncbi:MAG TPA: hypothetical protein VN948_06800 [Terriglobales bacterium]|nr:hypothetical protein [Terriglobales bacterium]
MRNPSAMRYPALLALIFASLLAGAQSYDKYGGLSTNACKNNNGRWHFEKRDSRWWACTPQGHEMFIVTLAGVFHQGDACDRSTCAHSDTIAKAKYGDPANWAGKQLARMKAWGFNAIGSFSAGPAYAAANNRVPQIYTLQVGVYAANNLWKFAAHPSKDMMFGLNQLYSNRGGWRAAVIDFFDPAFPQYAHAFFHAPSQSFITNSYVIGIFADDTDWFFGMGAGPDFPTEPPGHTNTDIAYTVLTTSPLQTFNSSPASRNTPQLYSDNRVFSKVAMDAPPATCAVTTPCSLRDYLYKHYKGDIAALNSAWGSTYTTFDSSGTNRTETVCAGTSWDGKLDHCSAILSYTNISPLSVRVKIDGVLHGGDCPWWNGICHRNSANTGSLGGSRVGSGFTPWLKDPDSVPCGYCTPSSLAYSVMVTYHMKSGSSSARSRPTSAGWVAAGNKLRVHGPTAKATEGMDVGNQVSGYDVYAICVNGDKGPSVSWCLPAGTNKYWGSLETLQATNVPLGTDWIMPDSGLVKGAALPTRANSINYLTGEMSLILSPPLSFGTHTITVEYVQNGWMYGSGLMDEDGRNLWVGTNVVCLQPALACDGKGEPLVNASPKLGADVDGWISQFAARYFKSIRDAIPATVLYLGPDSMGTWGAPARKEIMQGAAPYLDAIYPSSVIPQKSHVDYTQQWLGDKPMINQIMFAATPDSALFRYPGAAPGVLDFPTQAARGQQYYDSERAAVNMRASNGTYPYVGISFWGLTDFWNEKIDWGLVSLNDNAYDGHEAVTARGPCSPPLETMTCGGEERNYGDAISKVKQANLLWLAIANGADPTSQGSRVTVQNPRAASLKPSR